MKDLISKNSSILLVDDDEFLLENLSASLSSYFSDIKTCKNGRQAISILNSTAIDIVVTDYIMPELNGLALIEYIKANYPLIPVIMLTGNGSNKEVIESLKQGAFDVLEKPYRTEVLVNRIQNSLLLPRLIETLWAVMSTEFPTLAVAEFLKLPYSKQLEVLHQYSAVINSRFLNKTSERKKVAGGSSYE